MSNRKNSGIGFTFCFGYNLCVQLPLKNEVNFALSFSSPLSASFYIWKIIYTLSPFLVTLPFSFVFCISGEVFIIHKFLFHIKNKASPPSPHFQRFFYQQKSWYPFSKANLYFWWVIFNYPCSKSFTLLRLFLKPQLSCLA